MQYIILVCLAIIVFVMLIKALYELIFAMAFKNKNVKPVVRRLLENPRESWSYSAFEWIATILGLILIGYFLLKYLLFN